MTAIRNFVINLKRRPDRAGSVRPMTYAVLTAKDGATAIAEGTKITATIARILVII